MTMNDDKQTTPWHKEQYVWLIILFPMLAVLGGIITIILAVNSNDGLVVDDYYKQGLEINRTLERDQTAMNYGLDARIKLVPAMEEVIIQLMANEDFSYPAQIEASFLNATRAGMDKTISLIQTEKHIYRGHLSALSIGKWYVHIEKDNWRIIKQFQIQ